MNWTLLAAYLLGVLATARATRLLTTDAYPPTEALRVRWHIWQANRETARPRLRPGSLASLRYGWGPLLTCPFCAAPYVGAAVLAAAIAADVWEPDLTTLTGWWWTLAVWASGVYLASSYVVRDEPVEEA